MPHLAYLSLGSNLDPLPHLRRALRLLRRDFEVTAISHAWRTPPADGADHLPEFINMVVALRTDLLPEPLYHRMKALEAEAGRQERPRDEPHEIDIDLLTWDDCVASFGRLHLPHRSIPRYAYVLQPLCDIAPEWRHPTLDASACELLERLGDAPRAGLEDLGALDA